jgi:protein-disulfide isomerase
MSKLTPPVTDRDHIQGSADAPVTLVEYGDYECPHCGAAHPVVQKIQARLVDRMRFVFRNFPLTESHRHAQHAAEAAEAAGAQNRFWEMHDAVFEHQNALDDKHLAQYAGKVGLDIARYEREMHEHTYQPRVREDFISGARSGVNGTPTFFINGIRHEGPNDFEGLLAALERVGRPQ